MATYHPPKIITTQASHAITADLAYEGHGKCGETVILRSDSLNYRWRAGRNNAWKMVVLKVGDIPSPLKECRCTPVGSIRGFKANNMESGMIQDTIINVPFHEPFEIMADITVVELDTSLRGTIVILYMNCEQS
jgi:hypothetical protein